MKELTIGTVVGLRYRILGTLGRGGMARVYRARHLGLRREVALKVLPPEQAFGETGERFEREARAAARLDHPGCVRVLDYGRWVDRSRFLAMELLDGPTLRAELDGLTGLPACRAMRLARDLLRALAHAHRAGVLHRDVKPENVMFTSRDGAWRPVLIDFGLARVTGEGPLTQAGFCVGSPTYLAPERVLGRAYDARADVYAIGVLLYELLAGIPPFRGRDVDEVILKHIREPAPPIRRLRPDLSPPLGAFIARALEKDPRRRFADAEEMLAALEAVPALEREQAARAARARREAETTALFVRLEEPRPSLARRLWGWLRFGSWRGPRALHLAG